MLELIQFEQTEKVTSTGMVFSFIADKPLTELKEQAQAMGYFIATAEAGSFHSPRPRWADYRNIRGLTQIMFSIIKLKRNIEKASQKCGAFRAYGWNIPFFCSFSFIFASPLW